MLTEDPPRPRLEAPGLALAAVLLVAIEAACLTRYGWFRDELYYLSCARRLAWGYVDHPPLSIAILAAVRAVAGDSLGVIRLVAAFASAGVAIAAAAIARELGGRRFAQIATALSVGLAPAALGTGHVYSMNVFDFLFWALAMLQTLRVLRRPTRGGWLALGALLGLGLLNKWSVLWLGAGIATTLLVTPARRHLATPGPWLAAALAFIVAGPNVAWEVRHGWPTLEFMHNARTAKMQAIEPLKFLIGQWLALGPGSAPLVLAGLVASLARTRWRPIAIGYVVPLAILFASGSARVSYALLAAPALLAAGATWWESRGRASRFAIVALALVLDVPVAPFALPVLPVREYLAYQSALGRAPSSEERHRMGVLPQSYADMFGWPELADSVARVAATLPAGERARAITIVNNYGEAGALERFGAGRVPTIACPHNNWFLWGPPAWDGSVAILVGRDSSEAAGEFAAVTVAGTAGHPLAMPYERDLPILVARRFRPDLATAWRQGRHYQ